MITTKVQELKTELEEQNVRGIAVDIDETLSNTVKWWFSRMLEIFGNPENLDWLGVYEKYRHSSKVPYWQTEEAKIWMEERRMDNAMQTELEVIENSLETVHEINEIVPVVAYITARPEQVISGTKEWLELHGFPEASIISRPNDVPIQVGNKWKANVMRELYPYVQGIIDDNVDFPLEFSDDYKGKVYIYNYESDPTNGTIDVVACKNWKDVLGAIKKDFTS